MTIEELGAADRHAVVETLAAAFREYAVMRFVIGSDAPDYDSRVEALVGYYCDKRLVSGWPVLGIRKGGEIVAVTLVSLPDDGNPAAVAALETELAATLGEEAFGRMQSFEQASDLNEPQGPHYFVGMLATRPEHQGKGYGRTLLDHVKQLAVAAGAAGVCLSTEDASNLPIYRHLGFEDVAEAAVGELYTWSLRWPNTDYNGDAGS